jgi:hypothetical protein
MRDAAGMVLYVSAAAGLVFLTVSWADDSRGDWWWQVGVVLLVIAGVAFVVADRSPRK